MLSGWDDFPVHQVAETIRHVGPSDRNFYDRYYFNLHGSSDELFLVITPEGTRGAARQWKSGFWRIADAAQVPLIMGFVDGATKTTGFGPSRYVNGDPHAWMDEAREFFADIGGLRPSKKSPMILASESDD